MFVVGRGWTLASDLRTGDSLRGPDGGLRTVAAPSGRLETRPRTVYDLTVSGLHTFYAVAGRSPVLVHNCNDIVLDGEKFPGQAHTIDEHVRPAEQEAKELSAAKTRKSNGVETPNSVRADQETAQKVVDYALSQRADMIKNWKRGSKSELTWRGTFGPKDSSLGTVYWENRAGEAAGNGLFIKLVRVPKSAGKHPFGYYVQTCYPI